VESNKPEPIVAKTEYRVPEHVGENVVLSQGQIPQLPNPSVAAVEDAAAFAAAIVRPEPAKSEESEESEETEEVAPLDIETLTKVAISPEIAEALAAEGLEIDQDEINRTLDESRRRTELEKTLAPEASITDLSKAFTVDELVAQEREEGPVTRPEFTDLKEGINSSFEEVASLLLEHQRQIEEIESRLSEHNKRGGHKI
jgi:hypothetical protein